MYLPINDKLGFKQSPLVARRFLDGLAQANSRPMFQTRTDYEKHAKIMLWVALVLGLLLGLGMLYLLWRLLKSRRERKAIEAKTRLELAERAPPMPVVPPPSAQHNVPDARAATSDGPAGHNAGVLDDRVNADRSVV